MTRLLLLVVFLAGCVLDPIPENMLAANLSLSAERLALLEEAQPDPPAGQDGARFAIDIQCEDGDQVVLARSYLDADGTGLVEIIIPPGNRDLPWTCSFSAPGTTTAECVDGPCEVETRFALGALRTCDSQDGGLLFSWTGDSRWLADIVADGADTCVGAEASEALPEVQGYSVDALQVEADTYCGALTVVESVDPQLGNFVGWSPFLCYRLFDLGGDDFVQASVYSGLEAAAAAGCPLFAQVAWQVAAQGEESLGFTSRVYSPDAAINLSAVLWDRAGGPRGRFTLSTWAGVFTSAGTLDPDLPGGLVFETSGSMTHVGAIDIPAFLLRDSIDGCPDLDQDGNPG